MTDQSTYIPNLCEETLTVFMLIHFLTSPLCHKKSVPLVREEQFLSFPLFPVEKKTKMFGCSANEVI